ncbi:DUF2079 domain-containing protein [Cryobacterium melibiosiphilum]|uniref:DUF2079 domain-containing protein n=1 Tax=Cryobacterium melibiosiphilum TaxID=995039 RepID=A0A3A5MVF5_9MICO|nr:DUF2079 domain-containing protein [Cryobacterium melibiosiphilum]RJT89174.1 DUF2079 domain-containing protein [Cryobacterium melibiosiphilum]
MQSDEAEHSVTTANVTGPGVPARVPARFPAARRPSLSLRLSVLVGAITAGVYTVFSAVQWRSFAAPSWDLGIFTQLAGRYATLQAPIVPIKGEGYNLLGDHFHPLLMLLGPVYAVFPHAFTLVVVQNLLFGVAAAVVASAAARRLGPWPGALFGLAFGLSWGLQGAVSVQFHEVAFAVPLLALSLAAYLRERWLACALWALPLVFVKEDLGLTVFALGLVLAWRSRRPGGLWLAVWGLSWFALASFVVLPALNPGGRWAYTSSMDLGGLLADPLAVFQPEKNVTVLFLLLASGLVALRSPLALVLLPTLAWRFLSDNHGYWGPGWQYSAVLMPILFCAALDGIARLGHSPLPLSRRYSRVVVGVIVVVAAALTPQLPLARLASPATEFNTERAADAGGALAVIPDGALVESDIGLMNYLVERTTVYWLGNENPVPDYLVVDHRAGGLPGEWDSVQTVGDVLHPDETFRTIYSAGGYEVAERVPGG